MKRSALLAGILLALGAGSPAYAEDEGGYRAGGFLQAVGGNHHRRHGYRHGRHHYRSRWRHGHSGGYLRYRSHGSHFAFGLSLPLVVSPPPRVVYVQPPPPPAAPHVQADAGCLQTREFTTRIVVDGREVDAYGTACLQRDGSWKQLGINLPQ